MHPCTFAPIYSSFSTHIQYFFSLSSANPKLSICRFVLEHDNSFDPSAELFSIWRSGGSLTYLAAPLKSLNLKRLTERRV